MSTGHLRGEAKPEAELYKVLGENDTPKLYAKGAKLDTSYDVPYAGGTSVDGKICYIDRRFYREIMSGAVSVKGMPPRDIIQGIFEHEVTESSVDRGDNPVDAYQAAHGFAVAKEEKFVRQCGVNPARYEECLRPALERCQNRTPENPPKDLWCGPYLDEPTARDKEILRIFRSKGVEDAFKASKLDAEYGMGGEVCRDCVHYGGKPVMDTCTEVCGIVRADRRCRWWQRKK